MGYFFILLFLFLSLTSSLRRQYRRACLKALNSDLMKELEYLDSFANENPKNYQIWQHRRVIVDALGTGNFEKKFCEKIFEEDAKNYHAWAHRYVQFLDCH